MSGPASVEESALGGPAGLVASPISVATGSNDREGVLIFSNGLLVAVLVRLQDEAHEELRGSWWLEAGFGPCSVVGPPLFSDLAEAKDWIGTQLTGFRH